MQDVQLQLHPGHKVGLTGANGCGKSSFFALLSGQLDADKGHFDIPPSWVIATVTQETPAIETPAIDYVLSGDEELVRITDDLKQAEHNKDGDKIAALHVSLSDIEGYAAKARAAELMYGLGFTASNESNPVSSFSGGWRMRLNLARALMCRSDLLLLDEPTNHLDLDAVIWLETWLKRYPGTLLLISHDRDFLDAVVNHVAHIEHQQLTLYRGGYSDFERQRAERMALQQSLHEKQQRQIAHLSQYIERFKAKATKAKQAQSRVKALNRMQLVSAAHIDSPFSFSFASPSSAPEPLLSIDNAAVGYGQTAILSNIALNIRPGARIGVLGPNGAGKSTLIKLLAKQIDLQTGKRVEGKALNIGYFAQHQLEQLRPSESPLQHMQRLYQDATEQALLDFLGGFDFRGEMAKSSCEHFSGGEKSRLALAILIWSRPGLLLLDEPTNHLDLEMRHALTLALQTYEGGLVVISHDRSLLRATCEQYLIVIDGQVNPFDGTIEDYADWIADRRSQSQNDAESANTKQKNNSYLQKKQDRQARLAQRRPLIKQVEKIEREMETLQTEKSTYDARLNDTNLYQNQDKTELQALLKSQSALMLKLESAEVEWLSLQEQLEAIPDIKH